MKDLFNDLRNKHEDIYKVLLFLFSAVLIVIMIPREGKFRYEFSKGKPWLHETLIAPFDFAISKTQEEIEEEEAEIRKNATPYFRRDTGIVRSRMTAFEALFEENWKEIYQGEEKESKDKKTRSFNFGRQILRSIFNKGVIQIHESIESESKDFTIFLLDTSNIAREYPLSNFYTLQEAFNQAQQQAQSRDDVDSDLLTSVLGEVISHNVIYDQETTEKLLQQQIEAISLSRGMIQKGERIISKGDVIDSFQYKSLESLRKEYISRIGGSNSERVVLFGQALLVLLAFTIIYLFLFHFRKDIFHNNQKVLFILLVVLMLIIPAILDIRFEVINLYALPYCILPIIIRAFYDTRLASFTFIIAALLVGFVAPNGFEFVFLQIITGNLAIFSIVNLRIRSQLFITAIVIFLSYSLGYIGFAIIQEGSFSTIDPRLFGYFAISSLMTLLSYPLIYLFEKSFGLVSDVTLMEISDTNSPLLRELASRAPGTFQHSLQVANLAEEAIFQIGGDALLVRTGALYHDIGKMDMPLYFIENQNSGINPHEELSFEESAEIIISHVVKGVDKARKNKIPESVIDFIRTHHGDTVVQYFYKNQIKAFPEGEADISKFTYPGPRPYSKETAVLMMADSVEAASRALKSYDAEKLNQLVDDIIENQIRMEQFNNANITFRDIYQIKKIFKKKLLNIYHARIEYPK